MVQLFLICVLGAGILFAGEPTERQWQIVDWNSAKKKFVERQAGQSELQLVSDHDFSSRNFSIHHSFSDDVYSFPEAGKQLNSTDSAKMLRAATIAYHIKKMEQYFQAKLQAAGLTPQLTQFSNPFKIRFDVPYQYSPTHYYDKNTKYRNAAITIPPSEMDEAKDYIEKNGHGWENEIWFAQFFTFPVVSTYFVDRVIDTALCPDVSYHEYTHQITGNFIGKNAIGRALSEGLSDYFAASVIDYPVLYSSKTCPSVKWQLFVSSFRIDRDQSEYSPTIESDFKSNLRFVPAVLWKYRAAVGVDVADKTILRATSKSNSMTLVPGFMQLLSDELYSEIKAQQGEAAALALVQKVEREIYRPRGLMTSYGEVDTIFPDLPTYQIVVENPDRSVRQICSQQNQMELNWQTFSRIRPTLYVAWHCNGVRIPFKIEFPKDPRSYVSDRFEKNGGLGARIFFASPAVKNPSTSLTADEVSLYRAAIQYAQKYYLEGGKVGNIMFKHDPAPDQKNSGFMFQIYYGLMTPHQFILKI